jgi:hypothetical protein
MAPQQQPRAHVRNAADPRQVRRAERVAREHEQLFLTCLARVLETKEGRLVAWELLERAGIYRSVFDPHGSLQSYKAGRQDFGHELLDYLLRAGDRGDQASLYEVMEHEARTRKRLADRATDAAHTPAASAEGSGRAITQDDEGENDGNSN